MDASHTRVDSEFSSNPLYGHGRLSEQSSCNKSKENILYQLNPLPPTERQSADNPLYNTPQLDMERPSYEEIL